jgi:hypothetical protein
VSLRHAAPALLGYAAVRLLGVLAVLAWGQYQHEPQSALHRLATLWDAQWYQHIVVHGYSDRLAVGGYLNGVPYSTLAFFPLYPWLIAAAHAVLPLSVPHCALGISWGCSLLAAWGIFALADGLYGRRAGVMAAVLWGILPVAVVESMAYTEPLFTALAAWAMYALLRRWWLTAGLLSSLACLTRPTGLAVAAAVGVAAAGELFRAVRGWRRGTAEPGRIPRWRPLLGTVVAPLGFVGFVAWVGARKGHWNGYFQVQMAWNSYFDFGSSTGDSFHRLLFTARPVWLPEAVTALVLIGYVVLLAVCVVQRQPSWLLAYSTMLLVIALGDAAYFTSRARFLLPAFGLLLPAAVGFTRLRSRTATMLVLVSVSACSAVYGGYLTWVYPDAP